MTVDGKILLWGSLLLVAIGLTSWVVTSDIWVEPANDDYMHCGQTPVTTECQDYFSRSQDVGLRDKLRGSSVVFVAAGMFGMSAYFVRCARSAARSSDMAERRVAAAANLDRTPTPPI